MHIRFVEQSLITKLKEKIISKNKVLKPQPKQKKLITWLDRPATLQSCNSESNCYPNTALATYLSLSRSFMLGKRYLFQMCGKTIVIFVANQVTEPNGSSNE